MKTSKKHSGFFSRAASAAWEHPFWALILLIGLGLVQFHGIAFWIAAAGWTGIPLSLGLELLALTFWVRGRWWIVPALLLTAMLLLAPQYELARPIHEAGRLAEASAESAVKSEAELQKEIAGLSASKKRYEENSKTRAGWLEIIESTQAKIETKRAELRELSATPPAIGLRTGLSATRSAGSGFGLPLAGARTSLSALPLLSWQRWLFYGMQALALLFFQWGNVLAVRRLARAMILEGAVQSPEPVRKAMPEPVHNGLAAPSEPPVQPSPARVSPEPVQTSGPQSEPPEPARPEPVQDFGALADEVTIRRLIRTVKSKIIESGLSINEWCKREQVNKRDLWLLNKHFEHTALGQPTISAAKLEQLVARFLSTENPASIPLPGGGS
ncbi:MAG: hypothetical protein FVQ81_13190 [Candidatus Glassbacteria bacterium]|nr:hypothetical protein [Candidatus Glassbacteria bacterium]